MRVGFPESGNWLRGFLWDWCNTDSRGCDRRRVLVYLIACVAGSDWWYSRDSGILVRCFRVRLVGCGVYGFCLGFWFSWFVLV